MTEPIRRLANLPGYDTAPDIYETAPTTTSSTSEEDASTPASETSEDEDESGVVSRRRLRPSRARGVFEGKGVEEGVEARVARLRREVEEVRALQGREEDDGVEELGRLLKGVDETKEKEEVEEEPRTLGRLAEFELRLAGLERSLGVETEATPLLPSLNHLDAQVAALIHSPPTTTLEPRLQDLLHDQRQTTTEPDLEKLYSLLPTLQTLAPTLPPLISRLQSLRTLHTGASHAAHELEELARRQEDFGRELQGWREGLERVEGVVGGALEENGRNRGVVEGWVREIEGRMEGLGR